MSESERVLVTGASGFIGTNLMQHLVETGATVLGLDVRPARDPCQRDAVVVCDILDAAALNAAVKDFQPTVVHHLAARTDLDGADLAAYAANVDGVRNLLDAAAALPELPLLMMTSTRFVFAVGPEPAGAYDYSPFTVYGESKVAGEVLVRESGLDRWVITRPTSIWGPWFEVPYRTFFDTVRRGLYVHPRGHSTRKAMGYVGNSIHQMIELARAPRDAYGRPYWISDYEPYPVDEWADEIAAALGARPVRRVPMGALRGAARVGDVLGRAKVTAPLTSFRLSNLTTDVVYDVSPTEAHVGSLPYRRSEGTARTVEWLRQHG